MTPSELYTIDSIVKMITHNEIRIPSMQRPFVWDKKQVENLFQSIFIGDIIGSIATLKTTTDYLVFESRKFDTHLGTNDDVTYEKDFEEKFNNKHPLYLVLDGQQRLQSLYCGLVGKYNEDELYFNKECTNPKEEKIFKYFKTNKPDKTKWILAKKLYHRLSGENNCAKIIPIYNDTGNAIVSNNIFKFFYHFIYKPSISFLVSEPEKNDIQQDKQRFSDLFVKLNTSGVFLFTPEAFVCKLIGVRPDLKHFFEQMKTIGDTVLLQNNKYYLVETNTNLPQRIQRYNYELEILFIVLLQLNNIENTEYNYQFASQLVEIYLLSNRLSTKDDVWNNLTKFDWNTIPSLIDYIDNNNEQIITNYLFSGSFAYLKTLYLRAINYSITDDCGTYTPLSRSLFIPNHYCFIKDRSSLVQFVKDITSYFAKQLDVYTNIDEWNRSILILAHLLTNEVSLSFQSTDNTSYEFVFWFKPFILYYSPEFEIWCHVKPSDKPIYVKKINNVYSPKPVKTYDDDFYHKWAQKLFTQYGKKIMNPKLWQSDAERMKSWIKGED